MNLRTQGTIHRWARSLGFLFASYIPEVDRKKPATGKDQSMSTDWKAPPKACSFKPKVQGKGNLTRRKTQLPHAVSVENTGCLNFHPSPAVMKHPSLSPSPLGCSQRRPCAESGLSPPPPKGNEATPGPRVRGSCLESNNESNRRQL